MESTSASTTPPVSSSPQPTGTSSKKFIPLIIGSVLIVVLLVVGITMMKGFTQQKSPNSANTQNPEATSAPVKKNTPGAFPEVSVSNWIVPATIAVQAPQSARLYQFRQNLTDSDYRQYATNFFTVDTADENAKRIVAYSTQTGASMLYMQKPTGSFVFSSDRGVELPASGSATPAQVVQFTQNVLKDPSLKLYAEYSKSNETGTRYYEFHRDWSVVGLPIINLFGLFNTPEGTPLKSLSLTNSAGRSTNAAYTNTTDNSDGKARANEFNTVTVGVKNGKVASFTSNIRPFALAGASSPVIAYDQAVTKLKSSGYTYIYTSPQGSGQVDREKMYPLNKATLTTAIVTDATIAYLEELPTNAQLQMIPYYIFKGTGDLQSGYKVNFLAAVPAVTTGVLGTSTTNTSLMAQNSQQEIPVGSDQSQQQGTLKFNEQGGIMKGSTKYEAGLPALQCVPPPDPSQLTDTQQDASGIVFGRAPREGRGDLEWYVVPEADWDVNKLQEAAQIVWTAATNNAVEADDEKLRRVKKIVEDFEEQSVGCPVRITGSSPTIFVYGNQQMTIVPQGNVTYSEPTLGTGWTVTGRTQDYLYYEYERVAFTRPSSGWNVQKSELANLSGSIAGMLGLKPQEASRLSFELNHAAQDVPSDSLFVGPINVAEVNAKLPLKVTSKKTPKVDRIHFYVGAAVGVGSTAPVSAPNIQPVARSPVYLLELGAAAE